MNQQDSARGEQSTSGTTLGGADVKPQTYEWIDGRDEAAVTKLLTSDRWVAEQKLDGMRCLVRIGGPAYAPEVELPDSEIRFFSHGGRALVQSAAAQHFRALRDELRTFGRTGEVVLDGELLTDRGELWVFDIPFTADASTGITFIDRHTPFRDRRAALVQLGELLEEHGLKRVRVVPQAVGTQSKADLLQVVRDSASEGVCFKDLDAKYDWTGERVKTVLKLKVKRTVDCIVKARNVGEGPNVRGEITPTKNAHLMVYGPGGEVPLGSCTMIGKPDAQPGDVVEVEYLSWKGEGGHLVQPNLLRIRDDKLPMECHVGQLIPSNRDVLEVLS